MTENVYYENGLNRLHSVTLVSLASPKLRSCQPTLFFEMDRIICFTILVTFFANTVVAKRNEEVYSWYKKITDQKFNCPAPAESELNTGKNIADKDSP